MNVTQFIVAHQEAILSGLSVVVGGAVRHFWPKAKAEAVAKLSLALDGSKPSVKALGLKVDEWVKNMVPGAGDARYAAAAAILIHEEPALAAFQPEMVAILTALGGAVKEVAADAAAQAPVAKP